MLKQLSLKLSLSLSFFFLFFLFILYLCFQVFPGVLCVCVIFALLSYFLILDMKNDVRLDESLVIDSYSKVLSCSMVKGVSSWISGVTKLVVATGME